MGTEIIQIRGINGTGKTTIVREFIEKGDFCQYYVVLGGKQYEYQFDGKIAIIGNYDGRDCGGIDGIITSPSEYAKINKQGLIFQSDRKYVKMLDNFAKTLQFWADSLQDYKRQIAAMTDDRKLILKKAIPYVQKWVFFGRFSAFLFLETLAHLMCFNVENYTIDWENGSTATSGLLNVCGLDKYADIFDKEKRLPFPAEKMDSMLLSVANEIKKEGGDDDTTQVETSLCAYRKFYKGSRYNGFYLDRMLGEIYFYINQKNIETQQKKFWH